MTAVSEKPVFDPKKSDEYARPTTYDLVSYLFKRDIDNNVDLYRTGILLDKDHIRFYDGPMEKGNPGGGSSITFGPFSFSRKFFRSNHFRTRADLNVDRCEAPWLLSWHVDLILLLR